MFGAIIAGASSILGSQSANQAANEQSAIGAQSAENASQRTMEMQRRSNEELQRQYELARRDTLPGRQTGVGAMNWLNQLLLPGSYQSYIDPSITGTPDYLQPTLYGPDGSSTVRAGEAFDPFTLSNFDPTNIKTQLDPMNFFSIRDPKSRPSIPAYNPSPGRRGTEFDGGQNLQFGRASGKVYDQNGLSVGGSGYDGSGINPGRIYSDRKAGIPNPNLPAQQNPQAPQGQSPFMPTKFQVGNFEASPGYGFRVNEGEKGVQNYLSANKMRLSGSALKAMERFRQGTASDEYGNFFNRELAGYQQTEQDKQNYLGRIFQMAGFGPQSVNTAATAGANTASGVAGINSNAGNALSNIALQNGTNQANIAGARASNFNNAIQSGMQNFLSYRQQQNMMDRFNRGSGAYNPYDDPSSRQYNEYQ